MSQVPPEWQSALAEVLATPQSRRLGGLLASREAEGRLVFPPRGQRLRALELTGPAQVRVVILGQDPYHGPGQAHGLAFSVPDGIRPPPSLANIHKELASDIGLSRETGNLEGWARQGVLLLNSALTVEAGQAGSHRNLGWEAITDAIVAEVACRSPPSVFLLWGSHAREKAARVPGLNREGRHLVLTAPHPSPLSAHSGFFGCRHFSKANAFLEANGRQAIDWSL